MPITASITLYCLAWGVLMRGAKQRLSAPPRWLTLVLAAAIFWHGAAIYQQIVVPHGFHFGIFKIFSLFFWTTNALVLASSLRLPLHNLFAVTLPISVIALIISWRSPIGTVIDSSEMTPGMLSHILLSILAYSVMIVATVQALVLAYQNKRLRQRHPGGLIRLLPPLETMETLLFEMLWVGEILLTAVIISGAIIIYNLAAQHLYHKIVFTAIAWVIYAVLLWGRHYLGWRGKPAVRWALSGFVCLLFAYIGTKLVYELLLR